MRAAKTHSSELQNMSNSPIAMPSAAALPETVSLDVADFNATDMYVFMRDAVVPRPIAWVSTMNAQGQTNLAPFSFFNVVSPYPPTLGFSCGPRGDNHSAGGREPKDTLLNIRAMGEFVVNISPAALLDDMVRTSDPLAHGESEFAHAGLTELASTRVRPPRVAGVPVAFECRTFDIIEVGVNTWIMGTVVHMHVDRRAYVGSTPELKHRINVLADIAGRPVGRLDRANYTRVSDVEFHRRKDGPN
jgi:flavin reductase (DIM6/NTAB) family NADH-FMN oxidoreductase RutF